MKSCSASLLGQEEASWCMELFCCLEKAIYHIVGSISGGLLGRNKWKKWNWKKKVSCCSLCNLTLFCQCVQNFIILQTALSFPSSLLHAVAFLPSMAPSVPLCPSCLPSLCRNPGAIRECSTAGSSRERLENLFPFPALIPSPWHWRGHSVWCLTLGEWRAGTEVGSSVSSAQSHHL